MSEEAFFKKRSSLIPTIGKGQSPCQYKQAATLMCLKLPFFLSPCIQPCGSFESSWQVQNPCFELMGLNSSNLLHGHFSLHTYKEIVLGRYIVFLFPEDLLFS